MGEPKSMSTQQISEKKQGEKAIFHEASVHTAINQEKDRRNLNNPSRHQHLPKGPNILGSLTFRSKDHIYLEPPQ